MLTLIKDIPCWNRSSCWHWGSFPWARQSIKNASEYRERRAHRSVLRLTLHGRRHWPITLYPGLFAPRVSQQYRDEQRRRRSQFDRGTTAAEREIVYVRTIAPKHSSMENDAFRATPCTYPLGKLWYEDDTTIRARGPRTSWSASGALFSSNPSSAFLRWTLCLPLSYPFFIFFFLLFFLFFFPSPSGKTNSLDQETPYQKQMGRWDLPEEEEEEKKVGNYLRSTSYAVKLETERTKAKYVSSTISVWGYCDILTSREKCHFTPCWLGCGVSIWVKCWVNLPLETVFPVNMFVP